MLLLVSVYLFESCQGRRIGRNQGIKWEFHPHRSSVWRHVLETFDHLRHTIILGKGRVRSCGEHDRDNIALKIFRAWFRRNVVLPLYVNHCSRLGSNKYRNTWRWILFCPLNWQFLQLIYNAIPNARSAPSPILPYRQNFMNYLVPPCKLWYEWVTRHFLFGDIFRFGIPPYLNNPVELICGNVRKNSNDSNLECMCVPCCYTVKVIFINDHLQ